jgi:hypothetical protein
MATLAPSPRSETAASLALDRAIDAAIAGHPTYRSGTTFVDAGTDFPGNLHRPYVVVWEDGREELHRRSHWRKVALGVLLAGLALLWYRRA